MTPHLPLRRRRFGRPWLVAGIVVAGAAALLLASGWPQRGWAAYRLRRAEQFTQEGYLAWQQGRIHEAELAFASASAVAPGLSRPRQLQGRMYLQQRRRAEGRALFAQLLVAESGHARIQTANLYLDTLIATGWFEEVPTFCLAELPSLPPEAAARWVAVAVEAIRLAGFRPGEWTAPAGSATSVAARMLLAARMELNAGDVAAVRRRLEALRAQPLDANLRFTVARLAFEAGGADEAWRWLGATDRPLTATELALNEIWWDARRGQFTPAAVERWIARLLPAGCSPLQFHATLQVLLECPDPAVAEALRLRFLGDAARLAPEQLAALWLHAELSRRGDETENPWQRELATRVAGPLRPLGATRFDAAVYLTVINTLPLARETVISLLPLVEGAAQSASVP